MDFFAQAIGIVAMAFNILSYQSKRPKGIITLQLFGMLLFSISFLMLDAYVGALLNGIGAVRAILFLKKDTLHTDKMPWLVGFGIAYLSVYVLNFTVFGKSPTTEHLIVEILPVVAMFASHLAYRMESTKHIRRICIISSVSWLIYNIYAVAVGAILCEVFSLVSIVIAMIRLDRKK